MNLSNLLYVAIASAILFQSDVADAGPLHEKFGAQECPYTKPTPTTSVTKELATLNRACPYIEGQKVLLAFSKGGDCDPYALYVLKNFSIDLAENANSFRVLKMNDKFEEVKNYYEQLALGTAITAANNKCYEEADGIYDSVIEISGVLGAAKLKTRAINEKAAVAFQR